jgi:AsmA protein
VQGIELPAVEGVLTLDGGPLQAEARWSGPLLADLDRHVVSSPRTGLALDGRQGDTAFRGSLAAAWVADLPSASMALTNLTVDALLPNPKGGTLALKVQGSAGLGLTPQQLEARGSGQLDDSRFEGRFSVQDFAAPAWDFDLDVDRIDLDRYRTASAAGAAPGPAATAADASAFDLSALRDLRASGRLRVGQLRAAGLTARQLQAGVQARDGRLDIDPLAADVYQGRVSGSLSLIAGSPPRLALRQTWSGIALGPLLQDALGKAPLTGRGNLVLDVGTQGATVAALLKALDGQVRIELRDGLVRGVDVAQAIRSAAALLGRGSAPQAGTAAATDATGFSEMSGSFRVQRGVAHTDDLRATTPLLRVTGSGDIDLGAGRLDALLKATVADTLAAQGGPEWQALRGQTVPVRLVGPFNAIGYRVDVASLVQDLARRKLEEKARGALPEAQQRLLDKFKGLLGK